MQATTLNQWPNDSDGDVFRRLELNAFDLTTEHEIDFNVDFHKWPPNDEAITLLGKHYNKIAIYQPGESYSGYVQFTITDKLTYELVIDTQTFVTDLMKPFGGRCESWGVWQE